LEKIFNELRTQEIEDGGKLEKLRAGLKAKLDGTRNNLKKVYEVKGRYEKIIEICERNKDLNEEWISVTSIFSLQF
jgi:hypothetical protein